MGSNSLTWFAFGLLIVAAIAFMVIGNPESALGITDTELARLVTGTALLIVIGSSLAVSYRGRGSLALKQAVMWLGATLFLIVIYTYRAEFQTAGNRVLGELVPGTAITLQNSSEDAADNNIVAITADRAGQFSISATVNGTYVEMILDTGASQVVLTDFDARRVGINVDELVFSVPVKTANGETNMAAVRFDDVDVGSINVSSVRGLVAKPNDLGTSLLGMSFLKSLSSFEIRGNQVILRR